MSVNNIEVFAHLMDSPSRTGDVPRAAERRGYSMHTKLRCGGTVGLFRPQNVGIRDMNNFDLVLGRDEKRIAMDEDA